MRRFRNILVGVDIDRHGNPTRFSEEALKQACRVGLKHNASLTILHVINMPPDTYNIVKLQPQNVTAEAEKSIKSASERLGDKTTGVKPPILIRFGAHWQELLRLAIESQMELVVLGTRSRNTIGRAIFGSTSNRMLKYCPSPVWVVKENQRDDYRDILVAHDMTNVGDEALSIGAVMASLYNDAIRTLYARSPC